MFTRVFLICISVASLLFAQSTFASGNSLQAGFGGSSVSDGSFSLTRLGYEGAVGSSIALGGRFYAFDYDIDEDNGAYIEEGSGNGVDFLFHFYPGRRALHGFYFGAAVGLASFDWNYIEGSFRGTGDSLAISIGFVLGGKIHFGNSPLYIEPSFNIPFFLSIDTTTSDGEDETSLEIAPSLGLSLGFEF